MQKWFIVSDVHSYYSELMQALLAKDFDINNSEHFLILCGDAFDRGSEAFEMYNFMKTLGDRLIYIRGNHEDLLFDCVEQLKQNNGCASSNHYSNGTVDTIIQFQEKNILDEVLQFIKAKSVNYYELGPYVCVHGWVPYYLEDGHSLDQKEDEFSCVMTCHMMLEDADEDMWKAARWYNGMKEWKAGHLLDHKAIICGHWHCSYGNYHYHNVGSGEFESDSSFEPFFDDCIAAIDACTAFSHKVNVITIDENELTFATAAMILDEYKEAFKELAK